MKNTQIVVISSKRDKTAQTTNSSSQIKQEDNVDSIPSNYTVTETKIADGYLTCEPFEVFVDENEKTYNYIIENKVFKADVKIVKIDITTGETIPIAGTAF